MNSGSDHRIVPGISISPSGQATVDASSAEVLFELALKLEQRLPYPVDVEHVLAAIVMAGRGGELAPDRRLAADDEALAAILSRHVTAVFENYGGRVSPDE